MNLGKLYEERFASEDQARKDRIWVEVCRYLQRFVPTDGSVLDIGCDRGYFIRNIKAGERWATDVRDLRQTLGPDIVFVQCSSSELTSKISRRFDRIFISNLLEHLRDAAEVVQTLRLCRDLLQPSGRVIVLQPNIKLVGHAYWDFLDHRVALTDESLQEAVALAGLVPVHITQRFLPYTTKSRYPTHPLVVRAYLAFPIAWRLFGKQTLLIATPEEQVDRAP